MNIFKPRTLYREAVYRCGSYMQIFIYPVFGKQRSRGRRRKPTKEAQKTLNKLHSEQKLVRLVNANFTENDIRLDLTYDADHLPEDIHAAQKQVQNFLRRLKRFRMQNGLPGLKYIWVTEIGSKSGRIHHHCIISGGVDVSKLSSLWGNGYTTVKPLVFDEEFGAAAIAKYLIKRPVAFRRWNSSKNLYHPQPEVRDGRISKAVVAEWSEQRLDAHAEIEARYGAKLADIKAFYNDTNTGKYIWLDMYQIPEKPQKKRRQHEEHSTSSERL